MTLKLITETTSSVFQTPAAFDSSSIANVTTSFTFPAFAWSYLNAPMPEMMTETFAVAPLNPTDFKPRDGENWTASTRMYWGTLNCTLALLLNVSDTPSLAVGDISIADEDHQWAADPPRTISPYGLNSSLYDKYFYDLNVTSKLHSLVDLSEDIEENEVPDGIYSDNEFYPTLNRYTTPVVAPNSTSNDLYALGNHPIFCTPNYWSAPARITASWEAGRSKIVGWTMTDAKAPLEFNATQLNTLWVDGVLDREPILKDVNPLNSLPVPKDFFNASSLYRGMQSPIHPTAFQDGAVIGNIASWALADAKTDFETLLDNENLILEDSMNKSFNNLFAFAMQAVLQDPNLGTDPQRVIGTRQYVSLAMTIDPILSRLLEGALGALLICGSVILYFSRSRYLPNNLVGDPDLLGSAMSLVADNEGLLARFRRLSSRAVRGSHYIDGFMDKGARYTLVSENDGSLRLDRVLNMDPSLTRKPLPDPHPTDLFADSLDARQRIFRPPVELRKLTGLITAIALTAVLIYGSVLYSISESNHGKSS